MTRIKICGITNVEDARCAAEAGADLIGFVFYHKSPRFVEPERAAGIAAAIREALGAQAPRFVGVFVDERLARVREIVELAGLDLAQLHGGEPPGEVRALYPRAFKALRPRTLDEAAAALAAYESVLPEEDGLPQLLVDGYHPLQPGGTGVQADAAAAVWLARRVRLLLAGGLTPETVVPAIEQVRPWGVDVSSGVEAARGIKDHAQVRAFVEAVRRVEERNAPS
jgi:phosphoribosylanthranilate isomerase